MVALEPVDVNTIYNTLRRAAPYAQLPRSSFEGVLDLLSGRYPSHEFAELRPRVNWDRLGGIISPRKGTQRLAILNAGTIPDRGTYGVFLAGNRRLVAILLGFRRRFPRPTVPHLGSQSPISNGPGMGLQSH